MTKELYDLCDKLRKDIEELNKKDDISAAELERVYKAVDIIKDIKTIEAMEDAGYSNAYPYMGEMEYSRAGRGSYNSYDGYSGNSYARGRDSMGRYTSRDAGYNRQGDREYMMQQINDLRSKLEQM